MDILADLNLLTFEKPAKSNRSPTGNYQKKLKFKVPLEEVDCVFENWMGEESVFLQGIKQRCDEITRSRTMN